MYEGRTSGVFLRFAVPQMLGLLFNSVYTIVDGMFIGNRLGRAAMAAAAVAVPLLEVLISLAIATASGAGVMISIRLSQGETVKARRYFQESFYLLLGTGLLIAVAGNLWLRPLSELLGGTQDILNDAMTYLRHIIMFAPFQLLSFFLAGMARNDGRPRLAMTALMLGAVSNIILDYLFMYPLNLGIAGAALATALGPIFSVLILLPHFLLRRGALYFEKCPLYIRDIKHILIYGFPSFIMEFSIGIVTFLYNYAIVHYGYGDLGLAAYLMIGYLMLIILTLFLGLGEGLQPVFSYFKGRGELSRSKEMLGFAIKVFLALGAVCHLAILLLSQSFYSVFSPNDTVLVAFASEKSISYFCGFCVAGVNVLMISYRQSTGATGKAFALSLLRSLIFPPVLIFTVPAWFGRNFIWVCLSAAEAMAGCCAALMVRKGEIPFAGAAQIRSAARWRRR